MNSRRWAWALSALLLVMAAGGGVSGRAEAQVDRQPDWVRKPGAEDLAAVWPAAAWKQGRGGRAVIHCKVSAQGNLFDCVVKAESPAGAGFGGAALALAPQFLLKPALQDGKPVAFDGVNIPITFATPDLATGSYIPGPGVLAPAPIREVSNVPWVSAPSYAEVLARYPTRAGKAGLGGRVALGCTFNGKGRLRSCDILTEEPRGYGFGAAAQGLSGRFEGPPGLTGDRSLSGVHTQISVTFAAESLQAKTPTIGKPKWAALPAGQEFERRFAPLARAAGVTTIRAVLNCTVQATGSLGDCQVAAEEPAGAGIGPAALELAPAFRLSVWTAEGLPVIGGVVQVPLRYRLP